MQSQAIHQHQQVEEAGQQQQGCAVLMRASADEGLGVVEQASQKVRAAGQRFRQGAGLRQHRAESVQSLEFRGLRPEVRAVQGKPGAECGSPGREVAALHAPVADGVHNAVDHLPQIPLALLGTQRAPEPRDVTAYVVDTISVSYHGNNTTHLDAPNHIYYKGRLYNGYPQSSYTDRGAGKDDVMSMKNGIFTRRAVRYAEAEGGFLSGRQRGNLRGRSGGLGEEGRLPRGGGRRRAGPNRKVGGAAWLRSSGPFSRTRRAVRFVREVAARPRRGHPRQRCGHGRVSVVENKDLLEAPDRKSTRLNSSHRCISY